MTRTAIQLRWHDIDMLGHMYNGQYQQLYDLGKSDYFRDVLQMQQGWNDGMGVITVSTHNNYYEPVELSDCLIVETRVEKIGTKSISLFQQMIEQVSGAVKSDSRTVLVGYNPVSKETFAIPQIWRERITNDK